MPDRPTFASVLNSSLPKAVGLTPDNISAVAAIVNECQQALLIDPMQPNEGWWGTYATLVFNLTVSNLTATLTTPREIARIIVLDICKRPRHIRNGFYEYLMFGSGAQPKGCNSAGAWCGQVQAAYERDNVPTLNPFPTNVPQGIRVFSSSSADLGRRVLLQGIDKNGNVVSGIDLTTATNISGEFIFIATPFASAAHQYQEITGILKDPTIGQVQIFTVDPVTGAQQLLTMMEPNETQANYRQYFLNGLPSNCCNTPTGIVQVTAKCKLDFIPVKAPSDYLIIQNVPALIEEAQARRYSSMDESSAKQLQMAHHAQALAYLNGQLDHYEGKVNTAVRVSLFNRNRLRPQPI